jgi:organic hydroperoxide reductase OsmC/OhrA
MRTSARVDSSIANHRVTLATEGRQRELQVPLRADGPGSSANGGELLCLALATCYCNDVYREAKKRGVAVRRVEVEAEAAFGAEGAAAAQVTYRARVTAEATHDEIVDLMRHTDRVAEIQNTVRGSCPVVLTDMEAEPA